MPLTAVDVALLPAEAAHANADCYVIIDLLRATTTMAVALSRGVRRVHVVRTVEEARERRGSALLAGEVGGLRPEGFDFGNSPCEMLRAAPEGQDLILATTNGTKAILAVAGRGAVIAASFANLSAAARAASAYERVLVVCAGTEGTRRFALEDAVAAGALVSRLLREAPQADLGDGALLALQLTAGEPLPNLVRRARHARYLESIGLAEDVAFATKVDVIDVVPALERYDEAQATFAALVPATEPAANRPRDG